MQWFFSFSSSYVNQRWSILWPTFASLQTFSKHTRLLLYNKCCLLCICGNYIVYTVWVRIFAFFHRWHPVIFSLHRAAYTHLALEILGTVGVCVWSFTLPILWYCCFVVAKNSCIYICAYYTYANSFDCFCIHLNLSTQHLRLEKDFDSKE